MPARATFSLEDDAFAFLKSAGGKNRSAYINRLLKEERQRRLQDAIATANQEEAEDPVYGKELANWDSTLLDGLTLRAFPNIDNWKS